MCLINLIKPYAELIYFASGIVLAVAAILALRQIGIAKKALKTQSKRDALKLTASECSGYFRDIIPLQNKLEIKEPLAKLFAFLLLQFHIHVSLW